MAPRRTLRLAFDDRPIASAGRPDRGPVPPWPGQGFDCAVQQDRIVAVSARMRSISPPAARSPSSVDEQPANAVMPQPTSAVSGRAGPGINLQRPLSVAMSESGLGQVFRIYPAAGEGFVTSSRDVKMRCGAANASCCVFGVRPPSKFGYSVAADVIQKGVLTSLPEP